MNSAAPVTCFKYLVFLLMLSGACLLSCKKDSLITSSDARLATSTDSLKFDTVFTSVGSVTQSLKINNLNDQKLRLTTLKLMGGSTSSFTININGQANSELHDIEIAADDSIYLFVTVKINPTLVDLPFVVRDSIQILYNGNTKFVQLEAFGQNANFLRNRVIGNNTRWTNNLPYVILGSLLVDTNSVLTLDAGVKVYAHANAPIIIDGSLVANGTKPEPVVFSGDRLDEDYKDLPASWPGIYFRSSSVNNQLTFTTVKNAYQALVAEQASGNSNPKLVLKQCIIDNAYDAGILGVNTSIQAENCLVANSGKNIYLVYGGQYNFTNCTVASYPIYSSRKDPVLTVTNFAAMNGSNFVADLEASFRNCIFWAGESTLKDEVTVKKEGSSIFRVNFDHCIYKVETDPANSNLNGVIKGQDPLFDSINVSKRIFDFHITKSNEAPGINKGVRTAIAADLDDKPRNIGVTDIGCYEKQ